MIFPGAVILLVVVGVLMEERRKRLRTRPARPGDSLMAPVKGLVGLSVIDRKCWSVLRIHPTNDLAAIKRAYRRQIKRCHPDVAGAEGHAKTIMLNEAYKEAIKGAI